MMGSVTLHCDGSLENAEMRAGFYIWQSLPTLSQIAKSKLPKKKIIISKRTLSQILDHLS